MTTAVFAFDRIRSAKVHGRIAKSILRWRILRWRITSTRGIYLFFIMATKRSFIIVRVSYAYTRNSKARDFRLSSTQHRQHVRVYSSFDPSLRISPRSFSYACTFMMLFPRLSVRLLLHVRDLDGEIFTATRLCAYERTGDKRERETISPSVRAGEFESSVNSWCVSRRLLDF